MLEPAYRDHEHVALPVTEEITANSLILPLFHDLRQEDQDLIVSIILRAAGMTTADPEVSAVVTGGRGSGGVT